MTEIESAIREIARKLLKEKEVDMVIGYERGSLPLRTTPALICDEKDVDKLIWDVTCENNIAKYLIGREGKIGIVSKGCDSRSIVACLAEKQIDRKNIFIIGVPCTGIVDRKKVESFLKGKEVLEAKLDGNDLTLQGDNFKESIAVRSIIDDSCLSCKHRNPPLYDVLVAEKVSEEITDDVKNSSLSVSEPESNENSWEYFSKELSKCIRCYACRNVCPLCYCKECFVDQNMPVWVDKTDDISDIMMYHIVRIFHVAGRCVECGACSRACPMGIDLRILTQKMAKLVKDLYGFEAGLNPEAVPPLTAFKQDDPQEFIK